MNQDKILVFSGIALLLAAAIMAFDSNLSEIAPVLLLAGFGCFGWLLFRRTWARRTDDPASASPRPVLAKVSALLGIAGLLGLGLAGLSLLDPALEEFALAGVFGALLLIFALLARIANGMYTRRVDAATGGLSIAAILILLVALALAGLVIYFVYLVLSW